jgi:hypothetical protein
LSFSLTPIGIFSFKKICFTILANFYSILVVLPDQVVIPGTTLITLS